MAALKRHEKESVWQRKPLRAALLGFRLCEARNSKDVEMYVE